MWRGKTFPAESAQAQESPGAELCPRWEANAMSDEGLGLIDVMPVGGTHFYHFVHAISRRRQLLRHRLVAEILDFDESLARGWSLLACSTLPVDDGSGMAKGIEHVGLVAKGYPIGVRTTIFHAFSVTEMST